jgi:hypothetical protein
VLARIRDNIVTGGLNGIFASGIINHHVSDVEGGFSMVIGSGSTVEGNVVVNGQRGVAVACPSNVFNNTITAFEEALVLNGTGCSNTNNVVSP